eukprot:TRINITY_DN4074_c0_g1_i1.p1 TRINITY_DN4074_c0_g1~~TRINITY_DN4074_c0_g1_i1.p1  ORF type:complete len:2122 (-),score=294.95 TRINITY_DN4074_c0_g1_i1:28-6393(-)
MAFECYARALLVLLLAGLPAEQAISSTSTITDTESTTMSSTTSSTPSTMTSSITSSATSTLTTTTTSSSTTTLRMCPPSHPKAYLDSTACCSQQPVSNTDCGAGASWVWCSSGANTPVDPGPEGCSDYISTTSSSTSTVITITITSTSSTRSSATTSSTTTMPRYCPLAYPFAYTSKKACCSELLRNGSCGQYNWQWCDNTNGIRPLQALECEDHVSISVRQCPLSFPFAYGKNKACCTVQPVTDALCGGSWAWCDGSTTPTQQSSNAALWCKDFRTTTTTTTRSTSSTSATRTVTATATSTSETSTTTTASSVSTSSTTTFQRCPRSHPFSFENNRACCSEILDEMSCRIGSWIWCDGTSQIEPLHEEQCVDNPTVSAIRCPASHPFSFIGNKACCVQLPVDGDTCGASWVWCDGTYPPVQPPDYDSAWCADHSTTTTTFTRTRTSFSTTTSHISTSSTSRSSTTSTAWLCQISHPFAFDDRRACCSVLLNGDQCSGDNWIWCDGTSAGDSSPVNDLRCRSNPSASASACPSSHPFPFSGNRACCSQEPVNDQECGSFLWQWCDGSRAATGPAYDDALWCASYSSTTTRTTTSSVTLTSTTSTTSTLTLSMTSSVTSSSSTASSSTTTVLDPCPTSHPFVFNFGKSCCSQLLADDTSCPDDKWQWCDGTRDIKIVVERECRENSEVSVISCPASHHFSFNSNKTCCAQQPQNETTCGTSWVWCDGTFTPTRPADFDTTWCRDFASTTSTSKTGSSTRSTTSTSTSTSSTTVSGSSTSTSETTTTSTSKQRILCPSSHPFVFDDDKACCSVELSAGICPGGSWVWCDGSSETQAMYDWRCEDFDVSGAVEVCADNATWTDRLYGSGQHTCSSLVANPSWCTDYDAYSAEAQRSCPETCGLCISSVSYTLLGRGYCSTYRGQAAGFSLDACARRCFASPPCTGFAYLSSHAECMLSDNGCAQRIDFSQYEWLGFRLQNLCLTDSSCPGGQVCLSGYCQDPCMTDADCSAGRACGSLNVCETSTSSSATATTMTTTTATTTSASTTTLSTTLTSTLTTISAVPFAPCVAASECLSNQLCTDGYCRVPPVVFVTTFEAQLLLGDGQALEMGNAVASFANAAGVSSEAVEITAITYQVDTDLSVSDTLTDEEIRAALASVAATLGIPLSDLEVTAARRLASRELAARNVRIVFRTENSSAADSLAENFANMTLLAEAFSAQGSTETPSLVTEPRQSVQVSGSIVSADDTAVAPAADVLSAELGSSLGVSVQAVVQNVNVATLTTTSTVSSSTTSSTVTTTSSSSTLTSTVTSTTVSTTTSTSLTTTTTTTTTLTSRSSTSTSDTATTTSTSSTTSTHTSSSSSYTSTLTVTSATSSSTTTTTATTSMSTTTTVTASISTTTTVSTSMSTTTTPTGSMSTTTTTISFTTTVTASTSTTTTVTGSISTTSSATVTSSSTTTETNSITSTASSTSSTTTSTVSGTSTSTVTSSTVLELGASSVHVMTFQTRLQLESPEEFEKSEYVQSVANVMGVEVSQVSVDSIRYFVDVAYSLDATLTDDQAAAAIARSTGSDPSAVEVHVRSTRRLAELRRLGTTITATVEALDITAAAAMRSTLSDGNTFRNSLLNAGTAATVTVTVTPTVAIDAAVRVVSHPGDKSGLAAPSSDLLTQHLEKSFTGVKATVSNLRQRTVVSTAVPEPGNVIGGGDPGSGADVAVAWSIAGAVGVAGFLFVGSIYVTVRMRRTPGPVDADTDEMVEKAELRISSRRSQRGSMPDLMAYGAACALCGQEASFQCAHCKRVWYCRRGHQIEHWDAHKEFCIPCQPEPEESPPRQPRPAESSESQARDAQHYYIGDDQASSIAILPASPTSPRSPTPVTPSSLSSPARAALVPPSPVAAAPPSPHSAVGQHWPAGFAVATEAEREWSAREAARRAEEERLVTAEQERIAREAAKRAEEERLVAAEQERIAREAAKRAEEERLVAAERERSAREAAKRAEEDRQVAEAAERARITREAAAAAAAKAEEERLANAARERIAWEAATRRAEKERLATPKATPAAAAVQTYQALSFDEDTDPREPAAPGEIWVTEVLPLEAIEPPMCPPEPSARPRKKVGRRTRSAVKCPI